MVRASKIVNGTLQYKASTDNGYVAPEQGGFIYSITVTAEDDDEGHIRKPSTLFSRFI